MEYRLKKMAEYIQGWKQYLLGTLSHYHIQQFESRVDLTPYPVKEAGLQIPIMQVQ